MGKAQKNELAKMRSESNTGGKFWHYLAEIANAR